MNVFEFPEQKVLDRLTNVVQNQKSDIEWPNVVMTSSKKKYEKSVFESSLSILANRRGTANIYTNRRSLKVCEQTFYVCNPFESFDYKIDSGELVETFNVHLNYGFYTKAMHALLSSDEQLLDCPLGQNTSYRFINHLHFRTPYMNRMIDSYRQQEEETFLVNILSRCLRSDHKERSKNVNIPVAKKSTREELFRRMLIAKDYIYSHYNNPELSVNRISKLVAMSEFHFLRIFKSVHGISPYQYIKGIRIEKARYLIRETDMPIIEIAYSVGFREPNAIYPVLKKELSKTPQKYRRENSNSQ